jgi:hypothetical protein
VKIPAFIRDFGLFNIFNTPYYNYSYLIYTDFFLRCAEFFASSRHSSCEKRNRVCRFFSGKLRNQKAYSKYSFSRSLEVYETKEKNILFGFSEKSKISEYRISLRAFNIRRNLIHLLSRASVGAYKAELKTKGI